MIVNKWLYRELHEVILNDPTFPLIRDINITSVHFKTTERHGSSYFVVSYLKRFPRPRCEVAVKEVRLYVFDLIINSCSGKQISVTELT